MDLRQSNKWKEFLLQEAVETIGLPPKIAHYLRQQFADILERPLNRDDNKHLTYIGLLVKHQRSDLLLPRVNVDEIERHLVRAVRTTLKKRGGDESMAAEKELYDKAVAPLLDFRKERESQSPSIVEIKAFKKRMMRNLGPKGLEIEPQFVSGFSSYVDNRMLEGVSHGGRQGTFTKNIKPIMELLAEDPVAYKDLPKKEEGFVEEHNLLLVAGEKAQDMLDNPPKDPDKVIHEFDNGYYWYDIGSHQCDIEAKEMGHCGAADDGTLYSLRVGDKRSVKRMILLAFDGSTVYQIKAKANAAPKEHLWRYVDWFLENMGAERFAETGKYSDDGIGFAEMIGYLRNKHEGQINFGSNWNTTAIELLNQYEGTIEQDDSTTLKIYYPPGATEAVGPAEVQLYHHAWWTVKDIIVDEDTFRIGTLIKQDAQLIANDTFYPNPHIPGPGKVYARGKQDRDSAMLEIVLMWSETFEPDDAGAESLEQEEVRLGRFLEAVAEMSRWLTGYEAAPEEDYFDYNGFLEGVQEKLEEYGVYRDFPAEQDAATAAADAQLELPLQERRTVQRWAQIIK